MLCGQKNTFLPISGLRLRRSWLGICDAKLIPTHDDAPNTEPDSHTACRSYTSVICSIKNRKRIHYPAGGECPSYRFLLVHAFGCATPYFVKIMTEWSQPPPPAAVGRAQLDPAPAGLGCGHNQAGGKLLSHLTGRRYYDGN